MIALKLFTVVREKFIFCLKCDKPVKYWWDERLECYNTEYRNDAAHTESRSVSH